MIGPEMQTELDRIAASEWRWQVTVAAAPAILCGLCGAAFLAAGIRAIIAAWRSR